MKYALLALALVTFSACAEKDIYDLKSPCVAAQVDGAEQTPCERRPANAPRLG